MGILRKAAYLAVALAVASCGGAGPAQTKPAPDPLTGAYVTKGGGGAIDQVKALTSAFSAAHPTVVWQGFDDVGSDASVALTASGDIDVGYISRDLRAAEKGTVETLSIGSSGTGVGINAANPVKALTKEQVRKIFSGQISDWKDVGGSPGKIRVLVREPGAATRSAFESYFFGSDKPTYAKDVIEVFQLDETVKAIGSFKDAIGMMSMNAQAFTASDVRLLTIDGIAATKENLANGTYPIRRPLYFVYNTSPAKVKPAIKAFLDFVKGPEGQKVLAGL
jgi:phosphate transport system substrate-binding protein